MGKLDVKVEKKDGSDTKDFEARSARERISLDDFVHRKGQVRALEEFKYRKQRKKVQTAKALRSYRKVMKREGYEAGQGASRKRVDSSNHEDESNLGNALTEEGATKMQKRRHKTDPFQKSVQKAEEKMEKAKQHQEQQKENEKQRLQKLKERQQRTKLLNKRTKRGQPIMKHMVDNLLHKLEKQHQS